jgi:hypothetical protein
LDRYKSRSDVCACNYLGRSDGGTVEDEFIRRGIEARLSLEPRNVRAASQLRHRKAAQHPALSASYSWSSQHIHVEGWIHGVCVKGKDNKCNTLCLLRSGEFARRFPGSSACPSTECDVPAMELLHALYCIEGAGH